MPGINDALTLGSGLTLPNRLVKAAMAEDMANSDDLLPNASHVALYTEWAKAGFGMVITGNVQVDQRYLGGPRDIAFSRDVPAEKQLQAWKTWAAACNISNSPTIVQINHPGRQCPAGAGKRGFFEKSVAPSAIPLNFGPGLLPRLLAALAFGTPIAMTKSDIQTVIKGFADTAGLAAEAGFSGAEIHAAHGYLLAQFLSPDSNQRTDEYGGSAAARAKIVLEIIAAIRAVVPKNFCIGVKLNSVDVQSASKLGDTLEQLKLIAATGIDFLEISGGTYEQPIMSTGPTTKEVPVKSERTKAREAFFLEFAETIRHQLPGLPLMVTGGFRTRTGINAALSSNACDMIGIGRPAVLAPTLANDVVLNRNINDEGAKVSAPHVERPWWIKKLGISAVGAGVENNWYQARIKRIGKV
ncbi:NADH:flavin oxidoreductase/NADH oxidase [Hypoxylon argillaceum]|nr:NADH:flavin oxidoreductase/NADH oxidase [Hypoxylon argillaceum]